MSFRGNQRLFRGLLTLLVAGGLLAINGPTLVNAGRNALHEYKINSQGYKERYGHWSMLDVPAGHAGQRDPRGAAAHGQGADHRRVGQRP